MTKPAWIGVALLFALGKVAMAAPLPADLSENGINSATPEEWTARRDAATDAEKPSEDGAATSDNVDPAAPPPAEAEGREASEAETGDEKPEDAPDPFLVRLQVLLDRAHASPGVIDGRPGGNTEKAIRAYEERQDMEADGQIDDALWAALSTDAAPAVKTYRLTREDVDGRYVPELPADYGDMAKLDWMGFRGPAEMLAERFHMDEKLLLALNPGVDFKTVEATILVADPAGAPEAKVAHIVIDKGKGELFAYDADDRMVLSAPATIGSDDTPSPSGTMKVNGSAPEPKYEYDPRKNFQQGKNRKKLTIPPGPNGPVGSMWIDLSKPTYGIHGTPEPAQVGKTASHGCVRLTNWDAEDLARLVQPARTTVEFKG